MKQAKHLMCNIVCLRETGFVYSLLVQRCFSLFLYFLVFLFYFGFCIFYMSSYYSIIYFYQYVIIPVYKEGCSVTHFSYQNKTFKILVFVFTLQY